MSSNTLEIIQGLAQAAANAWDGGHDERYTLDGQVRKVGLNREQGCPIMDKRVNDGFSVKFYADTICINYQSDIRLKEAADSKFEQECERMLNEIKKFLQKEYKAITGKGITLSKKGDPRVLVQSTSRVRTWVQAYQHYTISGIKDMDPLLEPSRDSENKVIKKFLAQHSTKKPQNYKVKKGANQP
tara:strand:- start:4865 stop:5422 length:558 start_codon:yes stop_codon:yes gene_type:complete